MVDQASVPCSIVRGGTSKGVFVPARALPEGERDQPITSLFGSGDERQIDGLGGATSTTSKAVLVEESPTPDADVRYTVGQVGIGSRTVDYGANCGNLTFAVGAYAVDNGLCRTPVEDGQVEMTLYNTNSESYLRQRFRVKDGRAVTTGKFSIAGVPGAGAKVETDFLDPAGGTTGDPLPFGRKSTVDLPGGPVEVSVVDAAVPVAFVRAADVDAAGTELPADLPPGGETLETLQQIRGRVCEALGFVDDAADAFEESPATPKVAVVTDPTTYETADGGRVAESEIDLTARIVLSTGRVHPLYAVTGAAATAAGVAIPGTVTHEVAGTVDGRVRIGHPSGTMAVGVDVDPDVPAVRSVTIARTQRTLLEGTGYY